MTEGNEPSAASKRQDQLWLAKDEIDDQEKAILELPLVAADKVFEVVCVAGFGKTKNFERLTNSANRAKSTQLDYTRNVLLK